MRLSRVLLPAGFVAMLVMSSGCSGKPEGFQNACDHLSAAISAAEDDDLDKADKELNFAADWLEAAFEDTKGKERDAVYALMEGLNNAMADVGGDDADHWMAVADEACS